MDSPGGAQRFTHNDPVSRGLAEMAPWIKYFLWNQEDLGSDPQYPHEKPAVCL